MGHKEQKLLKEQTVKRGTVDGSGVLGWGDPYSLFLIPTMLKVEIDSKEVEDAVIYERTHGCVGDQSLSAL